MSRLPDRDQLIALIADLRELAAEARRRGDGRIAEPSLGYWYGVLFGLEDAADRLEALLQSDNSG